ncbi:NEK1 [Symbiodinium natans]|uniref:non-specific serine/threonine protein kinase n=1 Tax=Symbiodinium natans TaxID=878477 RepID=A0A812HS59_9DINO|nr:NEK1 [Symbiodinium natans]
MSSESTTSSRGYTKIKDIGSGSYGKAILVQDKESKLYVMKIIDMSRMDPKQRKDAINEVRVLSSLKHPYIVSYRESYMSEGRNLAIVMDYADGGDLHQRIQRTRQAGKVFSEERIVRWLTEAALALKYLHDKHVLHRDLKSQNLFLTAQDRLRIGDFGISRVLESTVAFAKTTIGTPYYLSPEICLEKPYTFSSDIWALGCVLYELACLRVPFDATSLQSLVQKITRGPTPVLPNSYSPDLRHLCGDLLHREQTQRPSAQEILQRPLIQYEIRRMLREEQAKGTRAEAGGPGMEMKKSPSIQSEARREHAESDEGGLSSRHWQQNPALKGVGASVCMEGGHVRDPSPSRQMAPGLPQRQWGEPIVAGAPRHATPGIKGRRP